MCDGVPYSQHYLDRCAYRLRARMDMNEYVARVLEREAAAVPEQAAKAYWARIKGKG